MPKIGNEEKGKKLRIRKREAYIREIGGTGQAKRNKNQNLRGTRVTAPAMWQVPGQKKGGRGLWGE